VGWSVCLNPALCRRAAINRHGGCTPLHWQRGGRTLDRHCRGQTFDRRGFLCQAHDLLHVHQADGVLERIGWRVEVIGVFLVLSAVVCIEWQRFQRDEQRFKLPQFQQPWRIESWWRIRRWRWIWRRRPGRRRPPLEHGPVH
jgi:hypothetical protein